ncbi:MAG: TetR/AcrR family transcriptional regulator, partial [Omnitrophica WOR_2 bacterium]
AINYYFRSKEVLIQRCMQATLENAFDWEEFARMPGGSPEERCTAIFENLLEGGCNFPGVTRAHFYELLTEGKYDSLAVKKTNEFMERLAANLIELGSPLAENELRMALVQITSAVMMMILTPRLFESSFGIDLCDEASRKQFVRRLVERLL